MCVCCVKFTEPKVCTGGIYSTYESQYLYSLEEYIYLQLIVYLKISLIYMYLYIDLSCQSVWVFGGLFVCLYPINVKTAEPIGPKFFVGPHGAPGKVYE